jgi:hypothetical protein
VSDGRREVWRHARYIGELSLARASFAGQRALLLDAVAMGLLRKYLVENFGSTAARTVLTQFGFAHGWRMAEAMRAELKWDSDEDWRRACTRLPELGCRRARRGRP